MRSEGWQPSFLKTSLVTDVELARGWEVDTAIVVAGKHNTCWINAVMRAVSHVVLVRIGTAVWRQHEI